jgi:hypothetical protein
MAPAPRNFDEDTSSPTFGPAIANVTGTPAATYGAPEQTMLADLIARVNAMNAVLKAAGLTEQD